MDADTKETETVSVPRRPTKEMLDAAYWAAISEDAGEVWECMIKAWLAQSSSGNVSSGSG